MKSLLGKKKIEFVVSQTSINNGIIFNLKTVKFDDNKRNIVFPDYANIFPSQTCIYIVIDHYVWK
jgi:hypothetical protein